MLLDHTTGVYCPVCCSTLYSFLHHHHHHLSRSCHCWQMASTTCAMHFDPGPFSSIDCQRLPRCHLSISFWVFLLVVFHLWVSTLMLFSPTWCSSFWLHVLPTVLSCTSLFLLYLSPLFSILLSRSWSCLSLWCSITISPCSVGLQHFSIPLFNVGWIEPMQTISLGFQRHCSLHLTCFLGPKLA